MIEPLVNAPWPRVLSVVVVVAVVLAPGFLFLAVFKPQFFAATDFTKLFFVAIAVMLPLLVVNLLVLGRAYLTYAPTKGPVERWEKFQLTLVGIAGLSALLPIYVPIAIKVMFDVGSARSAAVIMLLLDLPIVAVPAVLGWFCSPIEVEHLADKCPDGSPRAPAPDGAARDGKAASPAQ